MSYWIRRIRALLGAFWYRLYDDTDFIAGIEYIWSLYCKLTGYTLDNWIIGMTPAVKDVHQDDMPFIVYLDTSTLHKEWYSWKDFVNGTVTNGDVAEGASEGYASTAITKGWVVDVAEPIPDPAYLMDHVYLYEKTLLNGPDFRYGNGQILFFVNPESLHFPSVKVTTADGSLKVYWKLYGMTQKQYADYTAISGFMSPSLNDCADIVWDIHQNGATYYNTKKLLASAVDGVVCDADGAINEAWTEQGWNFMRVEDKIYGSKYPPKFNAGDNVKKGDILFGDIVFYKGSDDPDASQIPGIRIRTEAGGLVASNENKASKRIVITTDGTAAVASAVPVSSINSLTDYYILPLSGTEEQIQEYEKVCIQNTLYTKCPYVSVPSGTVNPYKWVTQVLRGGRGCAVRLTAKSLAKLDAAIECLRKSTCLSGLINVYVRDEADDDATVTVGFAADAGMGCVAVDATMTIQLQLAEARLLP